MHVLFHGITPSKELRKTFASHGLRLSQEKTTLELAPDLILFRIKSQADLKVLSGIRQRFPAGWIAVVLGDLELKDADLYAAILNNTDKNSVWHADTWESLIWFSIQELSRAQQFEKELVEIHHEVEESHRHTRALVQKLEKDLAVAERIQEKLIPGRGPSMPGIQLVSKYVAAPGLGGDYFDVFEIQQGRQLGILMVDSETHGMVAALLSVLLKLKVEDFKRQFDTAASFVQHIEKELAETTKADLEQISIFFGILDRKSFELRYSSTGSISPILWRKSKPVAFTDLASEVSLPLMPGDTVFLCTNGLYKVIGSEDRLLDVLSSMEEPISLNRLKNTLMGKIDAYTDQSKLEDDITFVEIGIDPKALVLKQTS